MQPLHGTSAGHVAAIDAAVDTPVTRGLVLRSVGGIDAAADHRNRARMQSAQPNFSRLP